MKGLIISSLTPITIGLLMILGGYFVVDNIDCDSIMKESQEEFEKREQYKDLEYGKEQAFNHCNTSKTFVYFGLSIISIIIIVLCIMIIITLFKVIKNKDNSKGSMPSGGR